MQSGKLARTINKVWKSKPTIEGAGVRLKRAFGFDQVPRLDPFLMLDSFRSDNPDDYRSGFPWHPHRGIETITYLLAGEVEHGDSMGNRGVISAGDVQWMTAGSGIIHQEMPKGDGQARLWGFQFWANLPASHKMMDPRYREVKRDDIPLVTTSDGTVVRVICGEAAGVRGPVQDVVTDPDLLDVSMPAGTSFTHPVKAAHTVFTYVIEGEGNFGPRDGAVACAADAVVLYEPGDAIVVATEKQPVRFLLAAGRPLGEPVAWSGPIVMNTQEELQAAIREYQEGTFVKHARARSA